MEVIRTNKEKLAKGLLIVITLLAVFIAVSALVQNVVVEEVPEPFTQVVEVVMVFFTSTAGTILVAYLRNIAGYLRNYYRTECKEVYDLNKLKETMMLYVAFVTTPLALLPAPYGGIVVGVVLVVDFVFSEYQKLQT